MIDPVCLRHIYVPHCHSPMTVGHWLLWGEFRRPSACGHCRHRRHGCNRTDVVEPRVGGGDVNDSDWLRICLGSCPTTDTAESDSTFNRNSDSLNKLPPDAFPQLPLYLIHTPYIVEYTRWNLFQTILGLGFLTIFFFYFFSFFSTFHYDIIMKSHPIIINIIQYNGSFVSTTKSIKKNHINQFRILKRYWGQKT